MGCVTVDEARPWQTWLDELSRGGRVVREGDRWFAAEASRDPKTVLRGRLEALGPIVTDDPKDNELLLELEGQGIVLRTRIDGRAAWCDRRLLARIHHYTLDRLRREIAPVSAAEFLRFLACWQHVDPEHRLEGPRGVAEAIRQLAGFEVPAAAWEGSVLPARVRGYRREWLDQLTTSGEIAWGRLWGAGASLIRRTPICLVPREDLESWMPLASLAAATPGPAREPTRTAREVEDSLRLQGAMFLQEIARATGFARDLVEEGLTELIALGRVTCDSFSGLRWFLVPAWRRRPGAMTSGRWSFLPREAASGPPAPSSATGPAEFVARTLLSRTGVVFRKTLAREKQPIPWRDVARVLRTLEARGEVRGGRFVEGFDGEQYARPEAITLLRAVRRRGEVPALAVSAADPLNFRGILTPHERVAPTARAQVRVA
jgi:ATP-dependent Lhr-like helicase